MNLKTVQDKGIKHAERKRVGRGIGSGLGKTSGRGHKGWGARSGTSRRPGYEGGQMPIYRRVPKRGFTNARFRVEYTVVNVDLLNAFDNGATVDLKAILDGGLASKTAPLLKILGGGELSKKLTVRAQKFSATAKSKIEAAGGTAIELDARGGEACSAEADSSASNSNGAST
jgi:large subunit ribosomal protein L15